MKKPHFYHSYTANGPPRGAGVWVKDSGIITGTGASCYHWSSTYVCPHIVTHGQGRVRARDKTYTLDPGDMFSLWPGVEIEYRKNPETGWRVRWIHLAGEQDEALGAACGFDVDKPVLRPNRPEQAEACFENIFDHLARGQDCPIYEVIAELYSLVQACSQQNVPRARTAGHRQLVERARDILAMPQGPSLNVNQLAADLGVSRTALFLAFREELDTTPIDYITHIRIARARRLLRETDYKLSAVAAFCGFRNEKYFMRRFRALEGMTPGAYRSSEST